MKLQKSILIISLVFFASIVFYLSLSSFDIARPDDYDPYRYLYHALRNDTSEHLGDNYRIVDILRLLNIPWFGIYGFYLLISYLCLVVVFCRFSCQGKNKAAFLISLLICSYYLVQTGKDGILSLTLCGILALQKNSIKFSLPGLFLPFVVSSLCAVSIFIRIESFFYILFSLLLICKQTRLSIFLALAIALTSFFSGYNELINFSSEFLAESRLSSSIVAPFVGSSTFLAYVMRCICYIVAPLAVPPYYIITSFMNGSITLLLWLGFLLILVPLHLVGSGRHFLSFYLLFLPIPIVMSVNQVLHFRYVFIWLPFCILYSASVNASTLVKDFSSFSVPPVSLGHSL